MGLGSMGLGMASSLVRSGFDVAGCDVSPGAVARAVEAGVRGAVTLAEATAETDAVISVMGERRSINLVLRVHRRGPTPRYDCIGPLSRAPEVVQH